MDMSEIAMKRLTISKAVEPIANESQSKFRSKREGANLSPDMVITTEARAAKATGTKPRIACQPIVCKPKVE
jgi:hypothetical protein